MELNGVLTHWKRWGTELKLPLRSSPLRFSAKGRFHQIAERSSDWMSPIDVKRTCVRPFLPLRMRRRMSNSIFERLRQGDSLLLRNVADDQMAAAAT
jgi:hypothetical protein